MGGPYLRVQEVGYGLLFYSEQEITTLCLLHSETDLSMTRQVNGHFMADLDPLGLDKRPMPIELDPALYGFSDKDLDRE